jgi:hypothetical protein
MSGVWTGGGARSAGGSSGCGSRHGAASCNAYGVARRAGGRLVAGRGVHGATRCGGRGPGGQLKLKDDRGRGRERHERIRGTRKSRWGSGGGGGGGGGAGRGLTGGKEPFAWLVLRRSDPCAQLGRLRRPRTFRHRIRYRGYGRALGRGVGGRCGHSGSRLPSLPRPCRTRAAKYRPRGGELRSVDRGQLAAAGGGQVSSAPRGAANGALRIRRGLRRRGCRLGLFRSTICGGLGCGLC